MTRNRWGSNASDFYCGWLRWNLCGHPSGIDRCEATASHQAIGVLVSDTVAYFQDKIHQTSAFGPISSSAKHRFRILFWTIGLSGRVMVRPDPLSTSSSEKPLNKRVCSLIPYILQSVPGMLTRIKEGALFRRSRDLRSYWRALWHDGACARIVRCVGEPKLDV